MDTDGGIVIRGTGIITKHDDGHITVQYVPSDCEEVEVDRVFLDDFIKAVNIINEVRRTLECERDE